MSTKKTVYLGLPSWKNSHPGTIRSAFRFATNGKFNLHVGEQQHSLLAHGFNQLWCDAVNRHGKHGLDYFAMLHADVQPEWYWLDMLAEELERTKADIVSCVIPFRDDSGLTSTAIEEPGNPWTTYTRLTVQQCHQLPETFSIEDCGFTDGRCLLVNSGCWLARLGDWCREFTGFTIRDRIVRHDDGTLSPQVESEDWRASREWHHQLKLRVLATTRVQVLHHGEACWANKPAWGADRDEGSPNRLSLPGRAG